MRQTLFFIPAEVAGAPVFGFGWLLAIWAVFSVGLIAWQWRRHGWTQETLATLPLVGAVAAVIVWLLPGMVELAPSGAPLGVPIRGFGVMLLAAAAAGIGISAYRAAQVGLDPEVIYSLAFWMFICGVIGARAFYVLQYWHEYQRPTLAETLREVLNAAQGGLVVYGSVIGGLVAGFVFVRRRGLSPLQLADIIAPGMSLGQGIGRLGCFLNGCCYGGLCATPLLGLSFPQYSTPPQLQHSPPYQRHLELGWLHGVAFDQRPGQGPGHAVFVSRVEAGSAAERAGVRPGLEILALNGAQVQSLADVRGALGVAGPEVELVAADGRTLVWTIGELPAWSLPIHATQLYAAVDACLLALALWLYFPYRRRDGEVFALLVTIHPVARFVLESIRVDEPGQWGTSLTISQWISLGILVAAAALWAYLERQPPRTNESVSAPAGPA